MVDLSIEETPSQTAWRQEVRAFVEAELQPGLQWDFGTSEDEDEWAAAQRFWQKAGEKGWIGLTWPKEYYGLERSALDKWIMADEFCRHWAPPYPVVGLAVGGAILRLGTHQQRRQHLEGIASAKILWGEGFTEPDAGSDLASLETRAVRDGDEWVLTGHKTFGTAAHRCQWMYVLARTDQDAPKHAGLTCFLVPLDAPGLTMQPMYNMADGRQNMTFFDGVRLPLEAQLGDLNAAWRQIWFRMGGDQLDQGGPTPAMAQRRFGLLLEMMLEYCRDTTRNGRPLSEDPVVRLQLAELAVGVEGLKMLEFESFWRSQTHAPSVAGEDSGYLPQAVYKEFWPRFAQTCMEIIGPFAQIQRGRWAPLAGAIDRLYRESYGNHGGGTSQVKRMVVATRGLGLPR